MSARPGGAPRIAVIVPNYNDARHLPRCLGSVLGQTVPPDELIVVDDASSDDSVAVIRRLLEGCRYATLVENPRNLGAYGAVDAGLQHSTSEYALFLAANDWVLPGIFERAKASLARFPGAGVWSAMVWLVDEVDRPLRLHPSPVVALRDAYFPPRRCIALAHRHGNWFTGATLVYRRDAFDAAGRFDPAFMGFADLFTALTVASLHGAAYSPAPLAAIRRHRGSHLTRTLADPANFENILERIFERGRALAPGLFTPRFAERTWQRLRFSSVRDSGGATLGTVATRLPGWRGRLLAVGHRRLPRHWVAMRSTLAFVVLRPFDLWATFWNRALGWVAVRLRAKAIGARQ